MIKLFSWYKQLLENYLIELYLIKADYMAECSMMVCLYGGRIMNTFIYRKHELVIEWTDFKIAIIEVLPYLNSGR